MSTISLAILGCLMLLIPGARLADLIVKAITEMVLGAVVVALIMALILHGTGSTGHGPASPDPVPSYSLTQPDSD
ncbi:hypothetical protein F7R91_37945 [Streptomyces luteolifulvus]|jgi:hypothetical protein|uniref:Uncharacterized protein n=1 Tax=Streptomyces luteolifulvus TaxID=2615112 RepID=A0A6H9UPU1_9ACTN|nr:hypothetical protein [Streptomyces luteolifulvus]KAB1139970.1 hypothetical protein F7R91_37945 [Streptomyces luteolifulvus]